MKYKIAYVNKDGKGFSAFTNDESTMWELYTTIRYAYEAVYVYDMDMEDLVVWSEKPSFNRDLHPELTSAVA